MTDLDSTTLHASLTDPALASMTFLNEIAGRFPDAISFAAGRPFEEFFDLDALPGYLRTFSRYLAEERGQSPEQVRRTLFQYGRTKGVIHELVAKNLEVDEGIIADPESIVVTVGCQEAMALVLRALRADERDVALTIAPTYVGFTGAAKLVDMPVHTVESGQSGVDFEDLRLRLAEARASGLRPRVLYVMPDFANPSGTSMDLATRHELLRVAAEEDFLLLEDNPYGLFHGDAERVPTLKALDRRRRVVYLGSFAKTALPGARVGYVVADQLVDGTTLFADALSKIKSMLTVNTPPIAQAMVAGKLLEHDCSLVKANLREHRAYADNLRALLDGLAAHFPGGDITWNTPAGGFFVVVTIPGKADDALLERSASEHGVIWTPMHHFYDAPAALNQLRLSISLLTPASIDEGLGRLAPLLRSAR